MISVRRSTAGGCGGGIGGDQRGPPDGDQFGSLVAGVSLAAISCNAHSSWAALGYSCSCGLRLSSPRSSRIAWSGVFAQASVVAGSSVAVGSTACGRRQLPRS